MSELTPEQQAARDAEARGETPPVVVGDPPDATGATPPDAATADAGTTSDTTATQPGTDAPAAPADHPAAPEPSAQATPQQAPVEAPQFGATTPDTRVESSQRAADGPGFVVSKPLLTTGAYGHDVYVLAKLLEAAGHPNAVAAGLEAPMLTDELMRHVRAFQESQGIDPAGPQPGVDGDQGGAMGPPLVRRDHEGIVDWRTWAALYDAAAEDVELAVDSHYQAGSFA